MNKRSALVIGVTGKVGAALAESLVEDGWKVCGAARLSDESRRAPLESAGIEVIRYDVTTGDPRTLPDVDVLFLEIWDPARPDLIWPINYYGVGRVVERYAGVADIVNGCTINVYGAGATAPDEDSPLQPDSEYGRSRVAQEQLISYFAHRSGKGAIHVRYAHSNTAEAGAVRRMAEKVLAGESLGSNPDALTQVISLEDFVRVTKLSADRVSNPPTAVNCCHPCVWTQRELAEAIRERLGKGEVVFDRDRGGLEGSVYADVSRMVEWFGEPTVSVETLIGRAVADLLG